MLGAGGLREADPLHQLVDGGGSAVPRRPARAGLRLRRGVAGAVLTEVEGTSRDMGEGPGMGDVVGW